MGLSKADLLLRAGLAFSFLYAAWAGFVEPLNWIGFLPAFLTSAVAGWLRPTQLLSLFGVLEIFVALWLLFGQKIFYAALLAFALLAGIVAFNLAALDIVFRDVSLALAALALAALHWPTRRVKGESRFEKFKV